MRSERRTAIHMLTACDVSEIKSTQRLKVDAALMSHSGSIDAHFNKGPEQHNTTRVQTNH